jgi:signal transduction histidine kinase
MSFRTRLLLGLLLVIVVPLGALGIAVRHRVSDVVAEQYEQRVTALVAVIRQDVERQNRIIAARLTAIAASLADDNRFRQGLLQGGTTSPYVLDYAAGAMRQSGLGMLQIQNADGRILSSGHFRNEYDLLDPALPRLLARVPGGFALVRARTPEEPFLALARVDSVRIGTRMLTVVGGVAVDREFLDELAGVGETTVTLVLPPDSSAGAEVSTPQRDSAGTADSAIVRRYAIPFLHTAMGGAGAIGTARIEVAHSLAPLFALRRSLDLWFAAAVGGAILLAALVATRLAARISRPLLDLAEQSERLDLERLDVRFASDRTDEVGTLARVLGAMTERLRASVRTLREVERRAALGDLARQVNHDIKNGLIPIRNVFRHFSQVARDDPAELAAVMREREGTVQSAIEYLEKLATKYAALYPGLEPTSCEVNAIVARAVRATTVPAEAELDLRLAERLPPVRSDELALRRILENLLTNALDSLPSSGGRVTVVTEVAAGRAGTVVRLMVADTGKGMSADELDRAFADFYTTKTKGTGLGLSIVRRLVNDLGGTLRVETEPGAGTRFIIELPAEGGVA